MPPLLRLNPGLLVLLSLVSIATVVLTIISISMARAGLSLRPIVFFIVFFAIILLPQLAGHLITAVRPAPAPPPSRVAAARNPPTFLPVAAGHFANPAALFGESNHLPTPINAKEALPQIFEGADLAELAMDPSTGATILVAQCPTPAAVARCFNLYLTTFRITPTEQTPTTLRGTRPTAAGSDFVALHRTANQLFAFTAPTEDALASRRAIVAPLIATLTPHYPTAEETAAATPEKTIPLFPALAPLKATFSRRPIQFASVAALVIVASLWFFKGSSWAASSPPAPGSTPVPTSVLRNNILAIHSLPTPVSVTPLKDHPDTLEVTWKYEDARYLDLVRARRVTRTHRLLLRLDESDHTVRVREYSSAFDASAGRGGASLDWKFSAGITFFEYRYEKTAGILVLDDHGRPTGETSHEFTFDLQELKSPLIATVTKNGWTWRPVMLDAPKPFRFLTE